MMLSSHQKKCLIRLYGQGNDSVHVAAVNDFQFTNPRCRRLPCNALFYAIEVCNGESSFAVRII
jgi:hypothetical protein